MDRGRRIGRWMVASLSAYALVLHVLLMAGMTGPSHGARAMAGLGTPICHGHNEGHHDTPAPAGPHSNPNACALCSLGGTAPPLPILAVAPPPRITAFVPAPVRAEAPPPGFRTGRNAQPRAPPAVA